MSFYQEILAMQSPMDIGSDENKRKRFSVNFEVMATEPVTDFEREIGKLINDAGFGTFTVGAVIGDMFIGTEAILPTGNGPFVSIINTGGSEPESTHNKAAGHTYEHLSVQIVVRARGYDAAKVRALAIWRTLDGVRNTTAVA